MDDTKDLEKNQNSDNNQNTVNNTAIDSQPVDSNNSNNSNNVDVVAPVVNIPITNQEPEKKEEPENKEVVSEKNVVSETVIDADVNKQVEEKKVVDNGTLEEVSVNADSEAFNKLTDEEISADSVFKKVDVKEENKNSSTMKEGQEYNNQKKGFPYFVVFVVILVIICAFFIDDISDLVNKYLINDKEQKEEVEDKSSKEDKEQVKNISLDEIKEALNNSKDVENFENTNNAKLDIQVNDKVLSIKTTNYLNRPNITDLSVEYNLDDNIMMAICDFNNSDFGLQMSIFIIKEIALLRGLDSASVDNYIVDNMYTNTIDKGFELTHSEDGNNTYKIATNVKLDINK